VTGLGLISDVRQQRTNDCIRCSANIRARDAKVSNVARAVVARATVFGSDRPVAVAHSRRLRGELKINAAILEQPVIETILAHLGLLAGHRLGRQPVARRCKQPDAAQP
jgi:hypothetical protein